NLYFHHFLLLSFPTRRSSDLSFATTIYRPCVSLNNCAFVSSKLTSTPKLKCALSLAKPIAIPPLPNACTCDAFPSTIAFLIVSRSEEHTSELQSRFDLVCRLL